MATLAAGDPRRLWRSDDSSVRLRPAHKDLVRGDAFVQARTRDRRPFRMLTVSEE